MRLLVGRCLVDHLDERIEGIVGGKAMAVLVSPGICVDPFRLIMALRPARH